MVEFQIYNNLLFVVAGFIPASKPACLLLRAGINPAPTAFWRGWILQ